MLFSAIKYGVVAIISALLISSPPSVLAEDDPEGQSTFTSPGGEVSFGFTIPERSAGADTFFTLRVPVGVSWGAVGLGSPEMNRALILTVYLNAAADNVTFSPRYGQGNFEPPWLDEFSYEVLDGTGIVLQDDKYYMLFRARCTQGCRNWHNGHIDVSSPSVEATYAFGPSVLFGSDDRAAPLQYHVEHGRFQIDVKRTQGSPDAPVIEGPLADVPTDGTNMVDGSRTTGLRDSKSIAHACMMIGGILIIFPTGVALLHKKGLGWHVITQMIGSLFIFIGFGLGIATSLWYQRTRRFSDRHQIVGFIIIASLLAQPVLGFLHHRQFARTHKKGRVAMAHRWNGRVLMLLGLLNMFFGFWLSHHLFAGRIVFTVLLIVALVSFAFRIMNIVRRRRQFPSGQPGPNQGTSVATPRQPWRQNPPPSGMDSFGDVYSRQEAPPPQYDIGMTPVGATRARSTPPLKEEEDNRGENRGDVQGGNNDGMRPIGLGLSLSGAERSRGNLDLGPTQAPREFM